jgi:hypothetical protein
MAADTRVKKCLRCMIDGFRGLHKQDGKGFRRIEEEGDEKSTVR